jgi:hypothetical protein
MMVSSGRPQELEHKVLQAHKAQLEPDLKVQLEHRVLMVQVHKAQLAQAHKVQPEQMAPKAL